MNKVGAWFLGMFVGALVVVGGEAAAVAFTPSKTYLNGFGTTIVGDKIGNQGILGIVQNVNDFTIEDVPAIKTALDELLKNDSLGKYMTLDYDSIKGIKFTDPELSAKLQNAIKVTATLNSLGMDLGNFGKLSIFKECTEVTPTSAQIEENYKAYYYADGDNYVRAFNDDKTRVAPSGAKLYLPNLSAIPVTELFVGLSTRLGEVTYKEFMMNLMCMSEAELQNDSIYKIVGDRSLKELKDLDIATIKLVDVLEKKADNAKLFDLLVDLVPTASSAEDITIGDLSSIDISSAHLTAVLSYSGNESLYKALCDMCSLPHEQYGKLTIGHLETADMKKVHLKTLLSESNDNVIIQKLLAKDSTIETLAADINGLTINELFGEKCFTTDHGKAKNGDRYSLTSGSYTYDAGGDYYISEDAGVWLILAYDAADIQADGRANTFAPSTTSFEAMQNNPSSFSGKVGNSYIYQLISAGLIDGAGLSAAVTSQTLNGLLGSF